VILSALACVTVGYLCGACPWGLWLGRWFRGVDVRGLGSGNLGATNVYRSLGPALGISTLALDMLKGALPVWLTPALPIADSFPGGGEACSLAVGFAAIAGHVWTVFAGFKGGKGVATTFGVVAVIAPWAALNLAVVYLAILARTRIFSVSSLACAWLLPLAVGLFTEAKPYLMLAGLLSGLMLYCHLANLRRLALGEEPTIGEI